MSASAGAPGSRQAALARAAARRKYSKFAERKPKPAAEAAKPKTKLQKARLASLNKIELSFSPYSLSILKSLHDPEYREYLQRLDAFNLRRTFDATAQLYFYAQLEDRHAYVEPLGVVELHRELEDKILAPDFIPDPEERKRYHQAYQKALENYQTEVDRYGPVTLDQVRRDDQDIIDQLAAAFIPEEELAAQAAAAAALEAAAAERAAREAGLRLEAEAAELERARAEREAKEAAKQARRAAALELYQDNPEAFWATAETGRRRTRSGRP